MTHSKHWHLLMLFPRYSESENDRAIALIALFGDRGDDAEVIRQGLRARRIMPWLAKRNTEHGSGLGQRRWLVERTFAWLNHSWTV